MPGMQRGRRAPDEDSLREEMLQVPLSGQEPLPVWQLVPGASHTLYFGTPGETRGRAQPKAT